MKMFAVLVLTVALSSASASPVVHQTQDLQSIADFVAKVREIYAKFLAEGSDFVCSSKLQELLDILGFPDDLDGAVSLAQQWLCGEEEELAAVLMKRSSSTELAALQGFNDLVQEIWEKLKTYGWDLVCSSRLQDLLDLLGLPDELDGAVKLAQEWMCGEVLLQQSPALRNQRLQIEFLDTLKQIWEKLKTYSVDFVCSSKLQELMDVLGLPDQLDGTVKLAQSWICGETALQKRSTALQQPALQGFLDTLKEIWRKMQSYSSELLCSSSLQDLLDLLGLPDELDGAVKLLQDWACGDDEDPFLRKRSTALVASDPALQNAFIETVLKIWEKLKTYSVEFVCSSKLQELLDILGLPDQLDGAVKMAQNLIC